MHRNFVWNWNVLSCCTKVLLPLERDGIFPSSKLWLCGNLASTYSTESTEHTAHHFESNRSHNTWQHTSENLIYKAILQFNLTSYGFSHASKQLRWAFCNSWTLQRLKIRSTKYYCRFNNFLVHSNPGKFYYLSLLPLHDSKWILSLGPRYFLHAFPVLGRWWRHFHVVLNDKFKYSWSIFCLK